MENSRTRNSFRNMVASAAANIITFLLGIIARRYFVLILGDEYQGLNGLYTNVISMLGVVELGMGNAIIYNLYKPIHENDRETINSLMDFYRRSYHIIGRLVAVIGVAIIPLLPFFVKEVTVDINSTIVYLFFLADAVFSYFLSYKRSLLYARQENYIVQIIHIRCLTAMKIIQTLILYVTKNYYLYLVIMVVLRIVENALITLLVDRKYPDLSGKGAAPLKKEIKDDIFLKTKGLFLHQIGAFMVNGTDNMIISRFLGLVTAGLYSNYALIIDSIKNLTKQVIDATTPSVGNLLVTETREKQYDVFKKMRFIDFWLASFCGICLYVIMEPWVVIWIGRERLLPDYVMLVLAFNFFQKTMRNTYGAFKTAAGIFHEDRFVPIIESALNIGFSVLLVKTIGLAGVFIGTTISGLALWCYSYPKYVYRNLFGRSYEDYAKETIGYILMFFVLLITTSFIANRFIISNNLLKLIVNMAVCIIVPNVMMVLFYFRTDNFRYCIQTALRIINRLLGRRKRA